ncbi:MAG TPA: hypothetical protein ENI33_01325 [Thermoplasmatales archaeon]|nr:hypothetical protein [Thermoplasmatales archaeon]
MKKIVYLIGIACLMVIMPASNAVNFEITVNDEEGDIGNANIDITKIWTTVEEDKLIFHIKVAGSIDNTCMYQVTASNGVTEIGTVYSHGVAYFAGTTSAGQPEVSINGNTLTMKLPYGMVSSWDAFSIVGVTRDDIGNTDWATSSGEGNDNDGDGNYEEGSINPGDENPTDKSIDVKITNVKYSIEKSDGGQKWHTQIAIEGTTNGVDHVSLSFVTYYKNGSYDVSEWLKGPIEISSGSFMGNEIIKFSFNFTEEKWKKWKLEMDIKYPVTEPDYRWVENKKEFDKFVIYARAFKDLEETKWNQASYETKPSFTSNGAVYNMNEDNNGDEGGKTPGFELFAVALVFLAMVIHKKRK